MSRKQHDPKCAGGSSCTDSWCHKVAPIITQFEGVVADIGEISRWIEGAVMRNEGIEDRPSSNSSEGSDEGTLPWARYYLTNWRVQIAKLSSSPKPTKWRSMLATLERIEAPYQGFFAVIRSNIPANDITTNEFVFPEWIDLKKLGANEQKFRTVLKALPSKWSTARNSWCELWQKESPICQPATTERQETSVVTNKSVDTVSVFEFDAGVSISDVQIKSTLAAEWTPASSHTGASKFVSLFEAVSRWRTEDPSELSKDAPKDLAAQWKAVYPCLSVAAKKAANSATDTWELVVSDSSDGETHNGGYGTDDSFVRVT